MDAVVKCLHLNPFLLMDHWHFGFQYPVSYDLSDAGVSLTLKHKRRNPFFLWDHIRGAFQKFPELFHHFVNILNLSMKFSMYILTVVWSYNVKFHSPQVNFAIVTVAMATLNWGDRSSLSLFALNNICLSS